MSKSFTSRPGTTLFELILFLAFFSIAFGAVMVLLFGTGEQRKRQEGIALVDQTGMQLLQTISRRVRSAERVLDPPRGASGTVLTLQMAAIADNPTIITAQNDRLVAAEYDTITGLTASGTVVVKDFVVRNTSPADATPSVHISFTLTKKLGIPSQPTYSRQFETLVTLFPDDQQQGNACGCAQPVCDTGTYRWEYCDAEICEPGPTGISC